MCFLCKACLASVDGDHGHACPCALAFDCAAVPGLSAKSIIGVDFENANCADQVPRKSVGRFESSVVIGLQL